MTYQTVQDRQVIKPDRHLTNTAVPPGLADDPEHDAVTVVDENQPLLTRTASSNSGSSSSSEPSEPLSDDWTPLPYFIFIQIALMSNVFLYGFDGTITAATYAIISSEFGAANTASWLTTAYLVTSTAFQPLYGRVSDIFGRRVCFFISTITFALGCLWCGLVKSSAENGMLWIIVARALTGFGGGGLMTMATIVNSDMIPFRRRGMYQALQNGMFGFGAICGASFGGSVADSIGWRWCFLLQVPVSVFALAVGYVVIKNPVNGVMGQEERTWGLIWRKVDFTGAFLLVTAISIQLVGLSLGGNELPWSSPWVIASLVGSTAMLALFLVVEAKTSAIPVIPLRLLKGSLPLLTQFANVCAGLSAYAYLFNLPLFFQVVLLDSATTAGARLAIPSLATPIGGLIAGVVMSRWGKLITLVRIGTFLMVFGNALVTSLAFEDSRWKYLVYIFPANLGQGIVYPGILFTSLATFDHADHAVTASTVYLIRSLGTVYGVAITSAIVQTTLSVRLPGALGEIPDKWSVIDEIRHSVSTIKDLPPDIQLKAREVYYEGLRLSFATSTAVAAAATGAALLARARGLRSTK
ncbi:major facilitator superfamily domain-containing protein [Sordaria brevicollis]|uniref:Major facilitator superfamily domain-containing protein n=1 Tax=Sordaria brevicollis TaxID=83679 RepID=A0AAE0PNR6_SORBR|nr:major facilitator superfamily domain-containing protein [Sordaria brevicollis]